jgi:outer membrane lipoprotein LolB
MLSAHLFRAARPYSACVWRRLNLALAGAALALLAGCVQLPPAPDLGADRQAWSGRLSLQVQSEPPQAFSASFELKGSPRQGELRLSSPLGNTLLAARWSSAEALLYMGNEIRRFRSIDELIEQSTGAPLPVSALFAWLNGNEGKATGWQVDLTRQPEGRISARQTAPQLSDLRIILDRTAP